MKPPRRKKQLTRTVIVRVKPATWRALVIATRAYGSETVSEFVRDMIETTTTGDTLAQLDFARKLAGGGQQLALEIEKARG